jgi:histidyl-tRNA synthetase
LPAVGISFGRILDYQDVDVEVTKCIIISIDQDKESIEVSRKLRDAGISCFIMKKINKALDYASKTGIPFVIFVGNDEIKKNKFKLRNMKTGKEQMEGIKDIISSLRE